MSPKPWQLIIGAVVVSVLLAGGGYWVGTFHGPARVQVQEKEVERRVVVTDTSAQEQVKRLTEQLETLKQHTHVVRVVVVKPDGTKTATTTKDVDVARTEEKTQELAKVATVEARQQEQTQKVETEKRVETSRPDWRAGVLVGANVTSILTSVQPVYGAHVERRVLGPFSVGVWGLSSGVGGLSLSGEF